MKTIKLSESDLEKIVQRVMSEQEVEYANYMFFSNLEKMKKKCEELLALDKNMVDKILENGHDWADDHISQASVNVDQVYEFMMGEKEKESQYIDFEDVVSEGRKKKNVATNQKLWKQSLAWAKQRYDVCPSAYCNGAAVKRYNSKGGKWKKA